MICLKRRLLGLVVLTVSFRNHSIFFSNSEDGIHICGTCYECWWRMTCIFFSAFLWYQSTYSFFVESYEHRYRVHSDIVTLCSVTLFIFLMRATKYFGYACFLQS